MVSSEFNVALLYSGRWFGSVGQHYVRNHLAHLIEPAHRAGGSVDVYFAVASDGWCSADHFFSQAALEAELSTAFNHSGVRRVYAKALAQDLVPQNLSKQVAFKQRVQAACKAERLTLTPRKREQIAGWITQYQKLAAAEAMRRLTVGMHADVRHHDLVLRVRVDVTFDHAVDVASFVGTMRMTPRQVFAISETRDAENMQTAAYWSDWFWVTSEEVMGALMKGVNEVARGGWPIVTRNSSFWGLSAEAQTFLQLGMGGRTRLRPLLWNITKNRIHELTRINGTPPLEDYDSYRSRMDKFRMRLQRARHLRSRSPVFGMCSGVEEPRPHRGCNATWPPLEWTSPPPPRPPPPPPPRT